MISAMVAEFELVSFAAEGKPRELMSEANSENRLAPHQSSDVVDGIGAWFRIAGAVGEKHAIGFEREYIFGGSLCRNDGDFASFSAQLAQNVLLNPKIVGNYMETRRFVLYTDHLYRFMGSFADFPHVRAVRGNDLGKIGSVHLGN